MSSTSPFADAAAAGGVREGTWHDDECTRDHSIDAGIADRARALADQALSLAETGVVACMLCDCPDMCPLSLSPLPALPFFSCTN